MEEWKVEEWKGGRVEGWKGGSALACPGLDQNVDGRYGLGGLRSLAAGEPEKTPNDGYNFVSRLDKPPSPSAAPWDRTPSRCRSDTASIALRGAVELHALQVLDQNFDDRPGFHGFEGCKAWTLRLLCAQVNAKFMETGGECPWSAQFFAESIPHMVWVACADGSIGYFNQRTLDYTGVRTEELRFWGWLKFIHPEDTSLAEETWRQALPKGAPYAGEYRIRRKDGIYLWHQVRAIPVSESNGRIGKWVGTWSDIEAYKLAEQRTREKIARDISERKKAEQGLRENQARFERIIDSAMDAIISINEGQQVVLFNAAAERMFGCSAAEALGRPLDRFIPARFRAAHRVHVTAFGATGVTSRTMSELGELVALRGDGREFPIEAAISQTEVSGAKLFTVILRDITERKVVQEALSRSEGRLRALTARLQRAHEEEAIRIARELHDQLGRCLTTLKIDITLTEEMVSGQLTAEAIRSIHEKTRMMQGAIDEMVHVVRKISTELRPGILDDLGLPAAIEWQAKDFQKRSAVSCVLNVIEEDLNLSREQATAVFRIFQEILTNVARHSKAEKVWVHLDLQDGMVVLEVEDNGVGIAPMTLGEGKALGLLGMHERAAMFGGHVEIAGIPGKGTTVIVRMPLRGTNHENSDR